MKSQYSIRLYELFKSVLGKTNWYFSIEDLRKIFMCEKSYSHIGHFKSRVIEPAIQEINEKTDILVDYEYETEGRKVVGLDCTITYKSADEKLEVDRQIRRELSE